MDIFSVKGHEY